MAFILFLIVTVVFKLLCRIQNLKESFLVYCVVALVGLNVLWIVFGFLPFDPWGADLKSTAMVMYLLLNLIYPCCVLKKDEHKLDECLKNLVKRGHVRQRQDKYYLTPRGSLLAFLIKVWSGPKV